MNESKLHGLSGELAEWIAGDTFPCLAARSSIANSQLQCMNASHMACPNDDHAILSFLYDFVDMYRLGKKGFYSAAIIFENQDIANEEVFDAHMWNRLQSIANLDAANYRYDERVSPNPVSPQFSFSVKGEAFFIIGLHPASSRLARRFKYPTLVFNPHAQFEQLKVDGHYNKMKQVVRQRDLAISGSVNPMLQDFGNSSETFQYSGRQYSSAWVCPLKINHDSNEHHPAP